MTITRVVGQFAPPHLDMFWTESGDSAILRGVLIGSLSMSSRITIAACVALIGFASAGGLAFAENDAGDAQEDAQELAAQGAAKLSMSEAVALAEKEVPGGRVVSSEIDTENGIVSYVIDIEKDGVKSVIIDVRTGEVISAAAAEADDLEQTAAVADDDDEEEEEDDD